MSNLKVLKSKSLLLGAAAIGLSGSLAQASPLFSFVNTGVAKDSFGDVLTGYTGYTLSVTPDAGDNISALNFGDGSNAFGLFGPFFQDFIPGKKANTSTPNSTDLNNGSSIDSHFVVAPSVSITAQAEDSNNVNPAPAVIANDSSDAYGTGTKLIGNFGIVPTTNTVLFAYVVLANNATASYNFQVAQNLVGAGGQVTGTYTVFGSFPTAVVTNQPIISLTNTAPTTYGSQLGTHGITVVGSNGSYTPGATDQVANPGQTTAFTSVATFTPGTDKEVYALKLDVNGVQLAASDTRVAAIIADINASGGTVGGISASTITGSYTSLFPGYEVLLTANTGVGSTAYLGVDFSKITDVTGVTVTQIAAVPEPATAMGIVLGSAGLLLGRRKNRIVAA